MKISSLFSASCFSARTGAVLVLGFIAALAFVWSAVGLSPVAIVKGVNSVAFLPSVGDSSQIHNVKIPSEKSPAERRILYWVAPMDANYRKDQPGQSPMGMDLVPVYESAGNGAPAGEIRISPAVINNLGVRTAIAQRQRLNPSIEAFGVITHDEDSRVQVTVRTEGWIEDLTIFDEGEMVKRGDVLFNFYSPELLHAQDNYLSAVAARDQRLIRGALGRIRSLAIPEFRIKQLQALKAGEPLPESFRTLSYRAPRSGHVSMLGVREGGYITPASIVMEIVSIESVWLIAEVFERYLPRLKIGQTAHMSLDYFPNRRWLGSVEYLYPMLDPMTRSQRVRLRFDNNDRLLKPNMFASVNITSTSFDALAVPKSAVIRTKKGDRVVLALGEGRFRSTAVETGWQVGDQSVILSGLNEGDSVVVGGQFLLDSESSLMAELQRMQLQRTQIPPMESHQ